MNSLQEIIDHSPMVAFRWVAGPEWSIEYVTPNIARYGYTQDELYAGRMTFFDFVYPRDARRVRQELSQHLQEGHGEFILEYRMVTGDHQLCWVEQRIWVCRKAEEDADEPHCLQGIVFDITERKRSEDTIRYQALHDSLTDLPNRMLLKDRLAHALARARRYRTMLAVLFLDLDNFKVINATLGHAAGDHLLKGVTTRLRLLLRDEDTIARFGGDEFVILLPEMTCPDDAATVAVKIIRTLYAPFRYKEHDLYICTSIGISLYPRDGRDVKTLLQNADTALYHVKEQGRDGFRFYSPTMYQRTLEKLEIESQLRMAQQQDEFVVEYEPQVSLFDGQLMGMEALLYWQHPERGMMAAPQFMPVAEEAGCGVHISEWLLQQACARTKSWCKEGYPRLQVGVDLCERLFRQDNLVDTVYRALAETELAPHNLVLEISEDLAMRDVEYSIAQMRRLKLLGVYLVLDHFGRGYSSLIYLKKFPISSLKIDRSIIHGVLTDGNDDDIALAIITLAHRLQLTVIAEGVETEEQQRFLCNLQCDRMQGPLFSKALPPDSFEQLLHFLML